MMLGARVLIVEDDPDISNFLRILFQSRGYEVMVAQRGEDAMEMCRQWLPHAVILDIMLPDMDGYDVCRELRASLRTSQVVIVFLTQKDERSDKIHGLELGADDYITKPFDWEDLNWRVMNAIARMQYESRTNLTTGLPSGRLIEEQVLRLLFRRQDWALLYVGINEFESFGAVYGSVGGEEVLRLTARALGLAVGCVGTLDDFVGHVGGCDFIIITNKDLVKPMVRDLERRFDAEVGSFYDWATRQRGYIVIQDDAGGETKIDLMSLSIGVVTADDGPFADIREIAKVATEARRMSKVSGTLCPNTGVNSLCV